MVCFREPPKNINFQFECNTINLIQSYICELSFKTVFTRGNFSQSGNDSKPALLHMLLTKVLIFL